MKQTGICITIVMLTASSVFGEIFFRESFTQSTLAKPSANAGLEKGSLDFQFHQETGNRIRIQDDNQGIVYSVDVFDGIENASGTLYLSFTLRSLSDSNKDKYAGLFLYQDDEEVFGMGNDYTSENFSFWGADGKGISIGQIPVLVDQQVHMIVMRIEAVPSGPEKIRIWLDPFCLRSENRQPDHLSTDYEYELGFNQIRLRDGNQDNTWEFDEILVGSDWASVTPSDDQPGEYLERVTKTAAGPKKEEMIGEAIARFWPSATGGSDALPSFVLEKPRDAAGPVSASWTLKPQFSKADNQRFVYLDPAPEVDLYGTGEVTGSLLRNGFKIVLYNKDNYGYGKPDQLYQSHPWVLGVRPDGTAFGVIFDTPWKAELDLRAGILFSAPAEAPDFPVIIIEGSSPQEVMTKLAGLTGTMPMPPRWALGYQQCRYSYFPDARVRQVADTFRAKQIPCDVIWMDIDYMNGFRVFTFDSKHFPDPKATNDYLHSLGFHSVWMIDPGVKYDPGYFVYDSGTKEDVWVLTAAGKPFIGPVWPGDCVFPDYTMPRARQWWSSLYKNFIANGIDGIWNDMNEPAVFAGEWTMPPDNLHRGGGDLPAGPHIQYHNVYGMLMVSATREGIQNARPEKRPFVLSRANFLGGHRYAATWTGDNKATWEHLKWSIPMSLNLSLSGQPFNGPDIGGFVDNAAPQLWAHWISLGAFYPFSRAHSTKESVDQEPWSFGPETEAAARTALQRRYRLMPYLYTAFHEAHTTGMPVMRPLLFADTKNPALRMEDQAFLLGHSLLVVPRWAEDPALPGGIWRSVSLTGEDAQTDPYQCDLKVRGGSIVPLGPIIQSTEQINPTLPLTLLVVLDEQGQAKGTLYEDAGDGYGFLKDEYCLSEFNAHKQGAGVVIKCTQQEGKQTFEKRLATIAVIDRQGVHNGFGDLVSGVTVWLDDRASGKPSGAGK